MDCVWVHCWHSPSMVNIDGYAFSSYRDSRTLQNAISEQSAWLFDASGFDLNGDVINVVRLRFFSLVINPVRADTKNSKAVY